MVLTVENFITEIKAMLPRDRKHIRSEELINLILLLPDPPSIEIIDLSTKMTELSTQMNQIQQSAIDNSQEIIKLKDSNAELHRINRDLCLDVTKLNTDTANFKKQIESLEQYSRINNIEIVGIDEPNIDVEAVEDVILECLNSLSPDNAVGQKLVRADIDICHILPKKNNEHSHVVRFISRKSKIDILNAKRQQRNRQFKFRDKNIYINEHLTPTNKYLFGLAKQKQRTANYKHLWTRNGRIFMRKDDTSHVLSIDTELIINSL